MGAKRALREHRRLRRWLRLRGRGLFTGKPVDVLLGPATPDEGWRWAIGNGPFCPLRPEHQAAAQRRSQLMHPLGQGSERKVDCPEHILAAALILDLDDLSLRFLGPEAPILDGSALPVLQAMRHCGVQGGPPASNLHIGIEWRSQRLFWDGLSSVGRARTFIAQEEGLRAQKAGLFPGARPGDAVVHSRNGGHRYGGRPRIRREALHHKLLDLLGDLAPWRAQGPLAGSLWVEAPGHAKNASAIRTAFTAGALRRSHSSPVEYP